jgi:hypothetical protein
MRLTRIVVGSVWCAYFTPSIPIAISWVRGSVRSVSLYAATVSFVWLIVAVFVQVMLAGYYTNLRFALIYANVLAMLAFAIIALMNKARRSLPTAVACLMLSVLWFFVAAINAVV